MIPRTSLLVVPNRIAIILSLREFLFFPFAEEGFDLSPLSADLFFLPVSRSRRGRGERRISRKILLIISERFARGSAFFCRQLYFAIDHEKSECICEEVYIGWARGLKVMDWSV